MHIRTMDMYPFGDAAGTLHQSKVAVVNTKGRKDGDFETLGQDCVSVSLLPNGWEVLCLADGHGLGGEWPANRVTTSIPYFLAGSHCTSLMQEGDVEKALVHAFAEVQTELERTAEECGRGLDFAGCTTSVLLKQPDSESLWVATVGDSRIVLVNETGGVIGCTEDHKANLPVEKSRLDSCGAKVSSQTNGLTGSELWRVYVPGVNLPGLAVSRSFGDMALKPYGVFAEPDVAHWVIPRDQEVHCILASDGLWDFMGTDEVASFMASEARAGRFSRDILKDLLEQSRERWQSHGSYCDDISAIMATFDLSSRWKQVPNAVLEEPNALKPKRAPFCCVQAEEATPACLLSPCSIQ